MIRSGWGSALPRRLVLAAAAALIPVLAGCEAGNNAPTLDFHDPTDARGHSCRRPRRQERVRPRRAAWLEPAAGTVGQPVPGPGQQGAPDRLVSISAPGSATSVHAAGQQHPGVLGHPVFLTGPRPQVVLTGLTRTHRRRLEHQAHADVPASRSGHAAGAGDAAGYALRDLRATAADQHAVRHDRAGDRRGQAPQGDGDADASRDLGRDRVADPIAVGRRVGLARRAGRAC